MTKIKIIGLAGPAGSGKDTVADYLCERYALRKYSFASPLKMACREMFGLTDLQLSDEKKEEVIPFWGLSPRQMYQKLGTEGARDLFFSDIWVKRAQVFYQQEACSPCLIIDDVRFENEAAWIRSEGGSIIHVVREKNDSATEHDQHASEYGIVPIDPDWTIVNRTSIKDLKEAADSVLDIIIDEGL